MITLALGAIVVATSLVVTIARKGGDCTSEVVSGRLLEDCGVAP